MIVLILETAMRIKYEETNQQESNTYHNGGIYRANLYTYMCIGMKERKKVCKHI